MKTTVFLDIDGVLNNNFTRDRIGPYIGIDEENVEHFNNFLESLEDYEIVLSSTWRTVHSLDEINKFLTDRGYRGKPIQLVTEDIGTRAEEIQKWLEKNQYEDYIILDDIFMKDVFDDKQIWTSWNKGFIYPIKKDKRYGQNS